MLKNYRFLVIMIMSLSALWLLFLSRKDIKIREFIDEYVDVDKISALRKISIFILWVIGWFFATTDKYGIGITAILISAYLFCFHLIHLKKKNAEDKENHKKHD